MRILAIDTALGACAAAVFESQGASVLASESVDMQRGHAETIMPMIARVMDQARCEFSEIERIAVTVGPGSFTGLRVGISAARGIALATGKPAVGLSTLSAFATPHVAARTDHVIIAAVDARNDQVYFHVFAPNGTTLVMPRIDSARAAARSAPDGPTIITGSGAERVAAHWVDSSRPYVETLIAPDIAWVARLGAAAQDDGTSPKPLYLRRPDAHPQERGRLPRR